MWVSGWRGGKGEGGGQYGTLTAFMAAEWREKSMPTETIWTPVGCGKPPFQVPLKGWACMKRVAGVWTVCMAH